MLWNFKMSSAKQTVADTLNTKKNVRENPVKRTIAKLRHPARAAVSDSAAEAVYSVDSSNREEQHIVTGEYATSAGHAVTKEFFTYLQSDEGEDSLRKICRPLLSVARDDVARELLVSDELKTAFTTAGRQMVIGSAESLDSNVRTQWEKLPPFVTLSILPVIAIFGSMFMLGLLLALWRFALFGLHG